MINLIRATLAMHMLHLDVLVGLAVLLGTSSHFLFAASAIGPPTSLGANVGAVGEVTLKGGVCGLLETRTCVNYDGLRRHHHGRLHHHLLHSGLLALHLLHGLQRHLLEATVWLLAHHLLWHGLLHVDHLGLYNWHPCCSSHHIVRCLVVHLFLDSDLNFKSNININHKNLRFV